MSNKAGKRSRGVSVLSKDKVKAEVKEKVREIRLRQENWMRQREEDRGQTSSSQVWKQRNSDTCTTAPVQPGKTVTQESVTGAVQHSKQPSSEDFQAKGSFKSWLEARNSSQFVEKTNEKGVRHLETVTHPDGSETNVLQLDSSRSVECATPDPDWSRDQVLGPSSSRSEQSVTQNPVTGRSLKTDADFRLLPDQFEFLADEIISRVRKDLDLNSQPSKHNSDQGCHENGIKCGWSDLSEKQNPVDEASNVTHMSSHNCPVCSKIMLSPTQMAMLLSPCGHSLCMGCIKGRALCPCCHSRIDSSVANIMLQQIIDGFYQKRNIKMDPERSRHYQPSLYSEDSGSSYTEKYSNLKTRHEVLSSERSSICDNLQSLSDQIQKERKQLHNIEVAETKLTTEMERLQARLNDLRGHKEEYQVKVTELDSQSNEMNKKFCMLKDTLQAVEKEMEKVQLLAEETGR